MRVILSGATGFVGRALVLRLARDGHEIFALTRSPRAAASKLGDDVTIIDSKDAKAVDDAIASCDAIINLAGESVAEGRWTEKRKRELTASRVDTTRSLITTAQRTGAKIRAFISASAVGYYGDTGDALVDETRGPADDFLAQLCVAWEAAALEAKTLGARVALMRIGLVLGDGGGALGKMLPLFRAGLGGKLGNGRQWVSWIHLHDLVEAFATALNDDRYDGAINCVAPEPVTNAELTRALGALLHRPTLLTAPAFALKLALGGPASAILASQRALPKRLQALGFKFQFATLEAALRHITYVSPSVSVKAAGDDRPTHAYMKARGATHVLSQRTVIEAPLAEVFSFFSAAANLGAITPPDMAFVIDTEGPLDMRDGLVIEYHIKVGALPLPWKTVIEEWRPGERFVDSQHRGPYRAWFHEHIFHTEGSRTVMEDRVWYALPLGPLGRIAHALKVRGMLRRIFEYRATRIALRFHAPKQVRATATTLSPSASVS